MNDYRVVARNFSESSENKIHSDEIARKFGFRGALVPGVAVYGHLAHLPVREFAETWLAHSVDNLRLIKPAYHDEQIDLSMTSADDLHTVTCHDRDGLLLANLTTSMPAQLPAPENPELLDGDYKHPERVEITWETVVPKQPFTPWEITLTAEQNRKYIEQVAESLPIYDNGLIHPHYVLSLANEALMKEYIMPTWIHVGSETRRRQLLREGDTIVMRSVPLEKWQKKGHEFIRLYVTFWRDGELAADIHHTAIFKVAA